MALMTYKCPNCGGGLQFDPASGKFKCEFCLSEFTEREMKEFEEREAARRAGMEEPGEGGMAGGAGDGMAGAVGAGVAGAGMAGAAGAGMAGAAGAGMAGAGMAGVAGAGMAGAAGAGMAGAAGAGMAGVAGAGMAGASGAGVSGEETAGTEEPEAVLYTCPSCGAEVVTDATTAATFCYYCHNPVVVSGRLSGRYLPDYVLPFAMDKKEAEKQFVAWISKKKFVPKDFFSKDQIEKFSGIYFPYLLYSCQVDGSIQAEAEQNRTWTAGRIRYTEHKRYQVEREGCLDVKNLTRNALSKTNKELVEGVLPFNMEAVKPFQMGYLSGFQAEKRDMEKEAFTAEAEEEVKNYTVQNLGSSIRNYSTVKIKASRTNIRDAKWQYALLPVWVLTYKDRQRDKVYYFAMNGQTGKIRGKLPVDKGKLAALFAGVFFPVFAVLMIGGWFL